MSSGAPGRRLLCLLRAEAVENRTRNGAALAEDCAVRGAVVGMGGGDVKVEGGVGRDVNVGAGTLFRCARPLFLGADLRAQAREERTISSPQPPVQDVHVLSNVVKALLHLFQHCCREVRDDRQESRRLLRAS